MFPLELSKQASGFLRALPIKQGKQVAEKLKTLATDPVGAPSEPLQGFAPYRRIKSGEFRIICIIENDRIFVRLVGKRNDDEIYKALQRIWKS